MTRRIVKLKQMKSGSLLSLSHRILHFRLAVTYLFFLNPRLLLSTLPQFHNFSITFLTMFFFHAVTVNVDI